MAVTTIDKDRYGEQLSAKVDRVKAKFADFAIPPFEVFDSPADHYRMRLAKDVFMIYGIKAREALSDHGSAMGASWVQGRVQGVA